MEIIPSSISIIPHVKLLLCCWPIGIEDKSNAWMTPQDLASWCVQDFDKIFQRSFVSGFSGLQARLCWMTLSLLYNYLKLWMRFVPLDSQNNIVCDINKITENDRYSERKIIWYCVQTCIYLGFTKADKKWWIDTKGTSLTESKIFNQC